MNYVEYGEMYNLIDLGEAISEETAKYLFKKIFKGNRWFKGYNNLALAVIHELGVFHRDLKSENILIDKNFDVKFCDFGSCQDGFNS